MLTLSGTSSGGSTFLKHSKGSTSNPSLFLWLTLNCMVQLLHVLGKREKKDGFNAVSDKFKVLLAISWDKSSVLFEATSWTIMCQNLAWYSKLCQGKIKWVSKGLRMNRYLILFTEWFWKCLSKLCSMQVNPCFSKVLSYKV